MSAHCLGCPRCEQKISAYPMQNTGDNKAPKHAKERERLFSTILFLLL